MILGMLVGGTLPDLYQRDVRHDKIVKRRCRDLLREQGFRSDLKVRSAGPLQAEDKL